MTLVFFYLLGLALAYRIFSSWVDGVRWGFIMISSILDATAVDRRDRALWRTARI